MRGASQPPKIEAKLLHGQRHKKAIWGSSQSQSSQYISPAPSRHIINQQHHCTASHRTAPRLRPTHATSCATPTQRLSADTLWESDWQAIAVEKRFRCASDRAFQTKAQPQRSLVRVQRRNKKRASASLHCCPHTTTRSTVAHHHHHRPVTISNTLSANGTPTA